MLRGASESESESERDNDSESDGKEDERKKKKKKEEEEDEEEDDQLGPGISLRNWAREPLKIDTNNEHLPTRQTPWINQPYHESRDERTVFYMIQSRRKEAAASHWLLRLALANGRGIGEAEGEVGAAAVGRKQRTLSYVEFSPRGGRKRSSDSDNEFDRNGIILPSLLGWPSRGLIK